MKNGSNYLVFKGGDVADTDNTAPTTDAGYWQIVSRTDLISNMKSATPSSPVDASFFMTNPKNRRNWRDGKPYQGTTSFNDNGSFNANADGLYTGGCTSVGQWHKTFDNYQALTNLPNGKYQVTVKGFNRLDGGNNNTAAYMYANNSTITLPTMGNIGTENSENATRALVDDTYLTSPVTVTVTDGNLRVGVKCDANCGWVTWREFTIKFLSPQLSFAAEELPADGNMTAGQWYYIDISVAGNNYKATATNLENIVYTTDGTILRENESSVTNTFAATDNNLSATRYYVKSSTANNLVVEAASYIYEVGSATSDYDYVQGGEMVTITYTNAASNDPSATFAKNGNPTITFGGSAVIVNPISNGFTFTAPTVTPGTSYTLSIPANAFGYAANGTYNAAQEITFKAPSVFDGIYYLRDQTGKYVGRGSSYGTRACVNDWGLPLNIATDAHGVTTLQYYDTEFYVYVTGGENEEHSVYADKSINNGWTITKNGNAYNLQSTYTGTYLNVSEGNLALTSSAYGWTIHDGSAHKAQMTALKDTQAATAATAAGISGVTTASGLESAVSSWNATDFITAASVSATPPESFQPFYNWQPTLTIYTADIAISNPGLYKLTIQGFGRLASNEKVYALQQEDADVSPFYAFFGNATTPLMSVMDLENNSTNYGNNCLQYGGYYYPNGRASALAAFQDNKYVNTIWVYITEAGTYQYGIKIDGSASVENARWTCYATESVSLTYYYSGSLDYVEDGVHYYKGAFDTAPAIELTDAVPVANLTDATFSGTSTVTFTNPNGIVFANAANQVNSTTNVVANGTCATLVLADGHPFVNPTAFTAINASYTLSALAGGSFATLTLPFAAALPSGGAAYTLDQGVNLIDGNIRGTSVSSIAANSPVLVTAAGDYTATNAAIPAIASGATYTNGELVGTYSAIEAPTSSYVLQNHIGGEGVAFYLVGSTQPTVNPFRAYIKAQGSNVKAIHVAFGEDGIDEIANDDSANGQWYNLAGQRLSKPLKGVNIVNGKKVIIK